MIEIKSLSFFYGERKILKNINLKILKQEKIAIVGKSGSGKTTLLNLLMTNLKPTNGVILFNKQDISKFTRSEKNNYKQKRISNVFQNLNLFEDQTVLENLMYFNSVKNIHKLLKKINMFEYKDYKISTLSGGQKQKIAIARCLLVNSDIVIFDEITSSLDHDLSIEIIDFIFDVLRDKTIIFVSHDLEILKPYINSYVILEDVYLSSKNIIKKIEKMNTNIVNKNKYKQPIKYQFSFFSFLLCFLSVLCLFFSMSIQDLYLIKIDNNIKNYYDYKTVEIVNYHKTNKELEKYLDIRIDINSILYNYDIYINDSLLQDYTLKPIKDCRHKIVINNKCFTNENIKYTFKIKSLNYQIELGKNNFVNENNMFTTANIYYDYDFFYSLVVADLENKSEYIGFIKNDLIETYNIVSELKNFKQNPIFEISNLDNAYLNSPAINEYLILNELSKSYQNTTNLLAEIVIIFIIISFIIYYFLNFYRNIKKIAIFKNFGYSLLLILKNDIFNIFFHLFLNGFFLILILNILSLNNLIINLTLSLFIYLLFNCLSLIITYLYFEHKDLNTFLLEEYTC